MSQGCKQQLADACGEDGGEGPGWQVFAGKEHVVVSVPVEPPGPVEFPATADLTDGVKRNFQVFGPLDFLAEVTQHIPDKGSHLVRYYGWYSNKSRGMRAKAVAGADTAAADSEEDAPYKVLSRMRWAALIKRVYACPP